MTSMPTRTRVPAIVVMLAALVAAFALLMPSAASSASKVKLVDGKTTLKLDSGTAGVLTDLGVTVGPVGSAKASKKGIAFPITGGRVDAETLEGKIKHSGGLSLTAGSTVVKLTRFYVNVDAKPDLTAKLGGARVSILDLDLSDLVRKDQGSTVKLRGISATLTAGAATALNDAFGVTAFEKGLAIGKVKVKAIVG